MGVAKTLPNYKSFTFDGTNSRNYGVYITGQGVFNAPERNVEMVEIPGRNGAYALDKGNFNNIEVTYPAGIFADTEADFAQAVSDLRNFLCSKSGYCRLEDDYNSGEYRMAIYKSGLEVTHEMLIAGEFNIVFECKPQRYLTSGETATAVTSGGKVTNPTLFDAKPLIEAYGYGDINIGAETITIENTGIGDVILKNADGQGVSHTPPWEFTISDEYANIGDLITVEQIHFQQTVARDNQYAWGFGTNANTPSITVNDGSSVQGSTGGFALPSKYYIISGDILNKEFAYGTSSTETTTAVLSVEVSDGTTITITVNVSIAYNGAKKITISLSFSSTATLSSELQDIKNNGLVVLHSTKGVSMAYIDLDTGEAYTIENNVAVSINNVVQIPAELPVLPPGDTTFTYDNTITQFKVLPRWWKV